MAGCRFFIKILDTFPFENGWAKLNSDPQREMVSVLVPNFSSVGSLARAIKSVVSQTYSDLEIIIWDDGSSDGSLQLLHLTEPEYRYSGVTLIPVPHHYRVIWLQRRRQVTGLHF